MHKLNNNKHKCLPPGNSRPQAGCWHLDEQIVSKSYATNSKATTNTNDPSNKQHDNNDKHKPMPPSRHQQAAGWLRVLNVVHDAAPPAT